MSPSSNSPVTPSQDHPVTQPQVTVAGQQLTLFIESAPLIDAMLRDIRTARNRVWLETYIFLDDDAGRAVAEALTERARAGVDVRVLYDAIGSRATPAAFFQHLRDAGAQVHGFRSLWETLWHFAPLRFVNRRNHRKLLVIDEQAAYFGGMNIVDPSSTATLAEAACVPTPACWRDVHVRLVGPQQGEIAESFERSWRRARGQPVKRRPRPCWQVELAPAGEGIQFFDCGPGLKHAQVANIFERLFRAAEKRITFSMAYFLPVGRVLRELLRARHRGVFVRVVVPGESDIPIVRRATRHLCAALLRRHFHVYERLRNMLHSKVMVVDDQWTVLGSSNLDARSLWLNLEFMAVVRSSTLAAAVAEIIRNEIKQSQPMTLPEYARRGRWERFLDLLAWALRWCL